MAKSVEMLMPAMEKYAFGRLLQPFGNAGLHACETLCRHSKAFKEYHALALSYSNTGTVLSHLQTQPPQCTR